jgi:hypothetical protein
VYKQFIERPAAEPGKEVDMVFNCIVDFYVDSVDDNGFTVDENSCIVKSGSMWESKENQHTLTGAEIRLENLTGLEWIEISKERLHKCFKVIICDEHCKADVTGCGFWDTKQCLLHH